MTSRAAQMARHGVWLGLGVLLGACVVLTPSLSAQQVQGSLIDATTGRPISAAFVVLLDENAVERGRALTDRRGRFTIPAPSAGEFRLRSQIIGVRSVLSEPLQLEWDRSLEYRFEFPAVRVVLPALVVEGERTCREHPAEGARSAVIWEETRKALEAVLWTESEQMLRHRLVQYERELDPVTLELNGEQSSWAHSGVYAASSFRSPPGERLATEGYIQDAGSGDWLYYGPDAQALLSEVFAGTHCFIGRASDREHRGELGLAFEPVEGNEVPDVRGVLWVDTATAELRELDFNYTDPPWTISAERIGGHVEFERLANGPWIVRRWWLRIPVIGVRARTMGPVRVRGEEETQIVAIREVGGWVSEVRTLDGRAVGRAGGSSLQGTVRDSDSGEPLAGAKVTLVGTAHEAMADDSGRFRIDDLPQSTYAVTFTHEVLEDVGFVPPPAQVTVGRDVVVTVNLSAPARRTMRQSLCPGIEPDDSSGVLSGFVRDRNTKEPIADARVVIWEGDPANSQSGWADNTDWAGYYLVCGVRPNVDLTASAEFPNWEGPQASLRVESSGLAVWDFELREMEQEIGLVPWQVRGLAAGAVIGVFRPGGESGDLLESAFAASAFARFITRGGFQADLGFRYSAHGIKGVPERYRLSGFYLEPRYAFHMFSDRVAPFLGARVGIVWEAVIDRGAQVSSTGYATGLSLGAQYRLDRRILLEAGIGLGATRFGDFTFEGASQWFTCLGVQRELHTALPNAVQTCSPVHTVGARVDTPEPILHPDSGRTDRWLGLWVGLVVPIKIADGNGGS